MLLNVMTVRSASDVGVILLIDTTKVGAAAGTPEVSFSLPYSVSSSRFVVR